MHVRPIAEVAAGLPELVDYVVSERERILVGSDAVLLSRAELDGIAETMDILAATPGLLARLQLADDQFRTGAHASAASIAGRPEQRQYADNPRLCQAAQEDLAKLPAGATTAVLESLLGTSLLEASERGVGLEGPLSGLRSVHCGAFRAITRMGWGLMLIVQVIHVGPLPPLSPK